VNDPRRAHLLEEADRLLTIGLFQQAGRCLKEILSEEPDDELAHALLARCLIGERRLYAAEAEARLAVGIAPDLDHARHSLGVVLYLARNYAEAEEHLEAARALSPHDADVLVSLAALYRAMDRDAEALVALESALEEEPENIGAMSALGWLHLDKGVTERAAFYAEEALKISPEAAEPLVLMGQVLLRQGDLEAARDHARWALAQDATDPSALNLLVDVKARESRALGAWWRYSVWMGALGDARQIAVLVGAFLLQRVLTQIAIDLEQPLAALLIRVAWLGVAAYSWYGPAVFRQMLQRELDEVSLDDRF
jgi:tetratricopeptide (TPR) repeat protein